MAAAPIAKRARGLDEDDEGDGDSRMMVGGAAAALASTTDDERRRLMFNNPKFSDRIIELRSPPTDAELRAAASNAAAGHQTRHNKRKAQARDEAANGRLLEMIHVSTAVVGAKSTFLYSAITDTSDKIIPLTVHPNTDAESIKIVIKSMYGIKFPKGLAIDQYIRIIIAADHLDVTSCIENAGEVMAEALKSSADAVVEESVAPQLLRLPPSARGYLGWVIDLAMKPYLARFGDLDSFLTRESKRNGTDDFFALPIEVVGALLRSQDLKVSSEHMVFHAVSRWYSVNPGQESDHTLWKAVRYPNLGNNFVIDFVQHHRSFNRREEDEQKKGMLARKKDMDKLLALARDYAMATGGLTQDLFTELVTSRDSDMKLQIASRHVDAYNTDRTVHVKMNRKYFEAATETGHFLSKPRSIVVCGYPFVVRFVRVAARVGEEDDEKSDPNPEHDVIALAFDRDNNTTDTENRTWTCDMKVSCEIVPLEGHGMVWGDSLSVLHNERIRGFKRGIRDLSGVSYSSNLTAVRFVLNEKHLWARGEQLTASITFSFDGEDIFPRL